MDKKIVLNVTLMLENIHLSQSVFCEANLLTSPIIPSLTDPYVVLWQYVTGTLSFLGTISNIILLLVFLHFPKLLFGAGFFIALLLANYLVLCAAVFPASVYIVAKTAWHPRPEDCKNCRYYMLFHSTGIILSSWLEALLAVNRLVAVLAPTQYAFVKQPRLQWAALLSVVGLTLASTVPPFFDLGSGFRMNAQGLCVFKLTSSGASGLFSFNQYVPILLSAAALLTVIKTVVSSQLNLHRSRSRIGAANSATAVVAAAARRRMETTKMLGVSFAIMALCQLPIITLTLAIPYLQTVHPIAFMFCRFAQAVQCFLTPIVFLTMNKDYQGKIRLLWLGMKRPLPGASSVAPVRAHFRSVAAAVSGSLF
ncbi:hypothetical protein BV898_15208 [Hypsibius exemplaris]|uniref:G-protein coupled receptors family 1 profile domain-containing protein n=1 Tax=Hypsibius exemplaris TaxID=2072580 RepID=A0A9X6NC68_HYPEX|nr:hypothetical protein BV898_15208 [Hypsibius exemplaris]